MEGFFRRLNSVILLVLIVFSFALILGENSSVKSKEDLFEKYFPKENAANPLGVNGELIKDTLEVEYNPSTVKLKFMSDGYTGEIEDVDGRASWYEERGIKSIDTDIDLSMKSTIQGVPTKVYSSIRKINAPSDFDCQNAAGTQSETSKCLNSATDYSVRLRGTASSVFANAQEEVNAEYTEGQNIINVIDSVVLDLVTTGREIFANIPDQSRQSAGTVKITTGSDLCEFCPVSDGSGKIPGLAMYVKTAGNTSEGIAASVNSPSLPSYLIKNINENSNFTSSPTDPFSTNNNTFSYFTALSTETFTKVKDPKSIPSDSDSIVERISKILNLVINYVMSNVSGKKFAQTATETNLAPLFPTRKLAGSAKDYKIGYKFPLCVSLTGNPGPLPNPFIDSNNINFLLENGYTSEQITQFSALYDSSGIDKECLTKIKDQLGDPTLSTKYIPVNCAINFLGQGSQCGETSVEEAASLTVGGVVPLGTTQFIYEELLNLQAGTNIPFLNPNATIWNTQLNTEYSLTSASSNVSGITIDGKSSGFKETRGIVGGELTNTSKFRAIYANNNFSYTNTSGEYSFPKNGLTCDKNERPYYGSLPLAASVQAPGNKFIHQVSDTRTEQGRGSQNADDVVIMVEGVPISLGHCIKESGGFPIDSYGDQDIRVATDPITGNPSYAMFIPRPQGPNGEAIISEKKLALCKLYAGTTPPVGKKSLVYLETYPIITDPKDGTRKSGDGKTGLITYGRCGDRDCLNIISHDYIKRNGTDAVLTPQIMTVRINPGDMDDFVAERDIKTRDIDLQFFSFFDAKQYSNGSTGVVFSGVDHGEMVELKYININPEYAFTVGDAPAQGSWIVDRWGNFCEGDNLNICRRIGKKAKIIEDNGTIGLISAGAKGIGAVFPVNQSGNYSDKPYAIFSFDPKANKHVKGADEEIVNAEIRSGKIYVSLRRSASILILHSPALANASDMMNLFKTAGRANIFVTEHFIFDPQTFYLDCANILGLTDPKSTCGDKTYAPLGIPEVFHMYVSDFETITLYYTYDGLDQSMFKLEDALGYTYTGAYKQISGNEYSNSYVPSTEGNDFKPTPVRFKNASNGGIIMNQHIEKLENGAIREIPAVLTKFAKAECLKNLDEVKDEDVYDKLVNVSGTKKKASNTGDYNDKNPGGKYCEETWCVQDSAYKITNNDQLKLNAGLSADELNKQIEVITQFFVDRANKRTGSDKEQYQVSQYGTNVRYMCTKAASVGLNCSMLAAIWIQEATGRNNKPGERALGCGGEAFGIDFNSQVDCAVDAAIQKAAADPANGGRGKQHTATGVKSGQNIPRNCESPTMDTNINEWFTPLTSHYHNTCNVGLVVFSDSFEKCDLTAQIPFEAKGKEDANANWPSGKILTQEEAKNIAVGLNCGEFEKLDRTERNKCKFANEMNGGGNLYGTRPNLRLTFELLNNLYASDSSLSKFVVPISNKCYPGNSNPSTGGETVANADEKDAISTVSKLTLDVGSGNSGSNGYGISKEAANFEIMFDMMAERKGLNRETTNELVYKLKKGETFSLLHNMAPAGTPTDQASVAAAIDKKINDAYIDSYYINKGYRLNSGTTPGLGWCEFATAIRVLPPGLKDSTTKAILLPESKPTNNGGRYIYNSPPVKHYEHTTINPDSYFNKLLLNPEYKISNTRSSEATQTLDRTKYVSVFVGVNIFQDLEITNTSDKGDLVIRFERDANDRLKITYSMFFVPSGVSPVF